MMDDVSSGWKNLLFGSASPSRTHYIGYSILYASLAACLYHLYYALSFFPSAVWREASDIWVGVFTVSLLALYCAIMMKTKEKFNQRNVGHHKIVFALCFLGLPFVIWLFSYFLIVLSLPNIYTTVFGKEEKIYATIDGREELRSMRRQFGKRYCLKSKELGTNSLLSEFCVDKNTYDSPLVADRAV